MTEKISGIAKDITISSTDSAESNFNARSRGFNPYSSIIFIIFYLFIFIGSPREHQRSPHERGVHHMNT